MLRISLLLAVIITVGACTKGVDTSRHMQSVERVVLNLGQKDDNSNLDLDREAQRLDFVPSGVEPLRKLVNHFDKKMLNERYEMANSDGSVTAREYTVFLRPIIMTLI